MNVVRCWLLDAGVFMKQHRVYAWMLLWCCLCLLFGEGLSLRFPVCVHPLYGLNAPYVFRWLFCFALLFAWIALQFVFAFSFFGRSMSFVWLGAAVFGCAFHNCGYVIVNGWNAFLPSVLLWLDVSAMFIPWSLYAADCYRMSKQMSDLLLGKGRGLLFAVERKQFCVRSLLIFGLCSMDSAVLASITYLM